MSHQVNDQGFNVDSVALAAEALLREHPDALVCGLSGDGLIVPVPQSVGLWGQEAIEGRAVVDAVVAADRKTVIDTWLRARREGIADGKVRLLAKPSRWMTLHFLDLRGVHDVVLCILLPSDEVAEGESSGADELPPAAPRFCTLMEDESGVVLDCDEAFTQMFGYTVEEVIGKQVLDQLHPEDHARGVEGWIAMLSSRRVQQFRCRRKRKDGSWMWIDTTLHNFLNQPGRNYVLVEIIDVSAEMVAQEALQDREELLGRLIEAMPDGLLQLDPERNVVYHNPRLLEILHGAPDSGSVEAPSTDASGAEKDDAAALSLTALLDTVTEESIAAFEAAFGQVLDEGIDQEVEVDVVLPAGDRRRALMSIRVLRRSTDEVSGAITSVRDVTDSARARQDLEKRATFDSLTRCHNRPSILAALQCELERDDSKNTGVVYIDLDNFKSVNDTLGHAAGDESLVFVAELLRAANRDDDKIGRLGGDEFLVLLRGIPGPEVAMSVAQRICDSLRTSIALSSGTVDLRASAGVACTEGGVITAEELIERADVAMYRSKAQRQGLPVLATAPEPVRRKTGHEGPLSEDETRAPAPSPAPVQRPGEDVRRLGEALKARAEDVLERTRVRARASSKVLDDPVREGFERICTTSTIAVAEWMAGGDPDVARKAGREAWHIFGQLTAQRAAPLNVLTKRCMYWRDAASDVLRESATELGVSPEALAQALAVVQLGLDVSLVQMCENSETERERTDEELARRQEQLEQHQEELAFMATHDALTGLPNRTLMLDRGAQMLVRARRHQTPVAALFIEIDNVKSVNDTLGHGAGDELLRAVAERLDGVVRDTDALGRVGGDEFVVIAEELSLAAGPELIAERLVEALAEPFELAGEQKSRVTLTTSIGIATGQRASAEELLRDADIAMNQAKWDGKNRYAMFDSGMQHAAQGRMELEMDLRDALPNDEFFLVYQPTFDLRDMSPTGVEALLRWKHPTRDIVQPNDFIPLLEETGLIVDVGRWVLQEACRQGAKWREAGHSIGMAVNVSAYQLDTDQLIADIEGALSDSRLDPSALTIEITETTLMRNTEETARRLTAIKQLGVRIAIDDFGTGYSSLAHLQQFPVDALKIDRSFISRLTKSPEGETLIHTLVQLGKALSIETLAEGIEQQQELSLLQAEDCDSGQGFLYARPQDVDATEAFLENWATNGAPGDDRVPAPACPTHQSASTPTTRHGASTVQSQAETL